MLKRGLYAIGSAWWETSVALAANILVAVILRGKGLERGFDDTTTEPQDQVKGRFLLCNISFKSHLTPRDYQVKLYLLNVVIGQCSS